MQALCENQQVFPPVSRAQNRLYVLTDKYLNAKLHTDVKQAACAINGLLTYLLTYLLNGAESLRS